MPSMSSSRFLREYELQLQHEFDVDGEPAQWAPGVSGPRFWGEEDLSIDIADKEPLPNDDWRNGLAAACSSDEKFLAVSMNRRLLIYNVESRTLCADVLGHEASIERLDFFLWTPQLAATMLAAGHALYDADVVKYLLFVQGDRNCFNIWPMDSAGRLLDDSTPLPKEKLVNDAMRAMSADLSSHSDIDTAEIEQIRNELAGSIARIDFQVRQKHRLTQIGHMPSFGSEPFSKDGQKCLLIRSGNSTQHGMRPADDLPHIVVWDVPRNEEVCSLRGHTDAIMWAGWAVDDQAVVTASWDQTFKIWDAETGVCQHTIGPTNGQNWSGAISPDGQYVALSGGHPVEVAVYMVATGTKTATLTRNGGSLRRDWIRRLSWNPGAHEVVMESERRALLMDVNTGESRVILEYGSSDSNNEEIRMMHNFANWVTLFWAEEGRILIAVGTEKTICVWDKAANCKWRFQRPQGAAVKGWGQETFYLAQTRTVLSVDGDLKVRYWKL